MQRTKPLDIAEVLRDARLGDLRTLAEPPVTYDDLHDATSRLFDLLGARQINYVLVGGMAMLQYVEGRNTRDIDLILAASDLERLPELVVTSRDNDFARASFAGVQIDLLLTSNAVFEIVRDRFAQQREFAGREIRCATPEGLILLKLFALPSLYRQGEFARIGVYEHDVAMLLKGSEADAEALLARLGPHLLKTDIAELRTTLTDLRQRIRRTDDLSQK